MKSDNQFKIYTGNYIPQAGQPIVIIVADAKFPKRYAEYYILLNNSKYEKFFALVTRIDVPEMFEKEIDLEFLLNDALQGAYGKLDNYLFELNEKTENQYFSQKRYELTLSDKDSPKAIHIFYDFDNELKKILETTKSELLRNEITDAFKLPKIIRE